MQFLRISEPEEIARLQSPPPPSNLPGFKAQDIIDHNADVHWMITDEDVGVARCSLWWRSTPVYRGAPAGVIGHYAASNAETAQLLLRHACRELSAQNCSYALGPMDGNTWHRYRLVTDAGDEPPFFLEPDTQLDWPLHWQAAGFTPVAEYSSYLNTDLSYEDPCVQRVAQRIEQQGVIIRPLNIADYEAEMQRIFELSCMSFRANFLYTPLPQSEFFQMYNSLRPFIRPDLVLLAVQQTQLVGFVFALPDYLRARCGAEIDTVIIKTVAVLPGRAFAGLGNLLAAQCHHTAHELGYRRVIHALMHNSNHSRNISRRYARSMRRYALYGREL